MGRACRNRQTTTTMRVSDFLLYMCTCAAHSWHAETWADIHNTLSEWLSEHPLAGTETEIYLKGTEPTYRSQQPINKQHFRPLTSNQVQVATGPEQVYQFAEPDAMGLERALKQQYPEALSRLKQRWVEQAIQSEVLSPVSVADNSKIPVAKHIEKGNSNPRSKTKISEAAINQAEEATHSNDEPTTDSPIYRENEDDVRVTEGSESIQILPVGPSDSNSASQHRRDDTKQLLRSKRKIGTHRLQ